MVQRTSEAQNIAGLLLSATLLFTYPNSRLMIPFDRSARAWARVLYVGPLFILTFIFGSATIAAASNRGNGTTSPDSSRFSSGSATALSR